MANHQEKPPRGTGVPEAPDAPSKGRRGIGSLDTLGSLSKEQLVDLVGIYAKNLIAIDGVWFQAVEAARGMDEAMSCDIEAWERFAITETRRIKNFLGLPEHAGLEGLAAALPFKCTSLANVFEMTADGEAVVFRVVDCRVQTARAGKGMPYHPCKSVGIVEYRAFARVIDDRIECECLSCFPDVVDESCCCAWRFTLGGRA